MLEIIGYIVVAYGIFRLGQASAEAEQIATIVLGVAGIVVLVGLAIWLHSQADTILLETGYDYGNYGY